MVARRLRSLLHSETYPSEIARKNNMWDDSSFSIKFGKYFTYLYIILISYPSESHRFCDRVQDAYTLRCCPQVHGISHDTIDFVRGIITNEMNAGTDNPVRNVDLLLLFPWGCAIVSGLSLCTAFLKKTHREALENCSKISLT